MLTWLDICAEYLSDWGILDSQHHRLGLLSRRLDLFHAWNSGEMVPASTTTRRVVGDCLVTCWVSWLSVGRRSPISRIPLTQDSINGLLGPVGYGSWLAGYHCLLANFWGSVAFLFSSACQIYDCANSKVTEPQLGS